MASTRCPVVSGIEVSILRYLIQVPFDHIIQARGFLIHSAVVYLERSSNVVFNCSELCSQITELRVILYQIPEHRLL